MESIIKCLEKVDGYETILLEFLSSVSHHDNENTARLFLKLDNALSEKRRELYDKTAEGSNKITDGSIEEAVKLRLEFDDNLVLFKMGVLANFSPAISIKFSQMIQNLSDIRKLTTNYTERNKNSWSDLELHLKLVELEEKEEKRKEKEDLLQLHDIAQKCKYNDGVLMIISKLRENDPALADALLTQKKEK